MRRLVYAIVLLMMAPGLLLTESNDGLASARRNKRPNVLIIVTDDQREGLQVMQSLRKRFVKRGRSYPHAFATTPVWCPSRVSILTGKYAHNHRVQHNSDPEDANPRTMLQYYLRRAGYRTAIFGKYLNSWGPHRSPPYFNRWATFTEKPARSFVDATYNVNGTLDRIPGYYTDVLANFTTRFLRRSDRKKDRRPWMMYLAPSAPHAPYTTERKYRFADVPGWRGNRAVFERNRKDKPAYVTSQSKSFKAGAKRRRRQMRSLMSVDDLVGKVMRTVRRFDERNTIALFVSDNGMLWGEHRIAMKHVPYQQSVNIPLFLRWPGHIRGGSVDRRLVGNIDIAPTVLDAARVRLRDPDFDGKSLLDKSWRRNRILLEYFGKNNPPPVPPWAATRTKDYQYTEYYGENGEIQFREYYDLNKDPWELRNPYGDSKASNDPPNTASMQQQLLLDRSCADETCP